MSHIFNCTQNVKYWQICSTKVNNSAIIILKGLVVSKPAGPTDYLVNTTALYVDPLKYLKLQQAEKTRVSLFLCIFKQLGDSSRGQRGTK